MTVTDGAHATHVRSGPPPPAKALRLVVVAELVARHPEVCANVHCQHPVEPGQRVYLAANGRVGHVGCVLNGWPEGYVPVARLRGVQ